MELPSSDVRLALAVLLPRLACFALCVFSLFVLFWQTVRLGVYPFQITIARYDIVAGNVDASVILAPVIIFFDAWYVHGPILGTGILAGVGAGALAVPSFREIELVRMAGAHELGRGSRVVRATVAPLLVVTAVVAFFEAILPFKGGPLYLTMYAIPVGVAFLASLPLRMLLPY